jgi:hypothetical protein
LKEIERLSFNRKENWKSIANGLYLIGSPNQSNQYFRCFVNNEILYSENKFLQKQNKIVPAVYKFNSNTVTFKDQVYIIRYFEQIGDKVCATLRTIDGQTNVKVNVVKVINPGFLAK